MIELLASFPLRTLLAVQLVILGCLLIALSARRQAASLRIEKLVIRKVVSRQLSAKHEIQDGSETGSGGIINDQIKTLIWLLRKRSLSVAGAQKILALARCASVIGVSILVAIIFLLAGRIRAEFASPEIISLAFAPLGWFVPSLVLARAEAARHRDVSAALPDALELARICVESGMSLESALRRVEAEIKGSKNALSAELRRMIDDITVTGDFSVALKRMADRIPTKEMTTISSIFSQSLKYGAPLAVTLKNVTDVTQKSRMLLLEERASKFPAMVMLPGLVLMFPNFLLIMMAPAVLNLLDGLSSAVPG